MKVEARLEELGLVLPEPLQTPPGLVLPFSFVRVRGDRAYVSGHGALNPDGSLAGPFGKVGAEVSVEQGYEAARVTGLNVLAGIRQAVGSLDNVVSVVRTLNFVVCTPEFTEVNKVSSGLSDLLVQVFGERGRHARAAVGMGSLPNGMAVEVEMIVEVDG